MSYNCPQDWRNWWWYPKKSVAEKKEDLQLKRERFKHHGSPPAVPRTKVHVLPRMRNVR